MRDNLLIKIMVFLMLLIASSDIHAGAISNINNANSDVGNNLMMDAIPATSSTSMINPSSSPQFVITSGASTTILTPPLAGFRSSATLQNITATTVPIWLCYSLPCTAFTASFQLNSSKPEFIENTWSGYMWSITSSGTATILVTDKLK